MTKFLLVASYPDSLITFRGKLIEAIIAKGFEVHLAVPDLDENSEIYKQLNKLGVKVHSIGLQRTGMNPVRDIKTIIELFRLMRRIKAKFVLGYTIKPVIYGSLAAWFANIPHRISLITGLGYAFTGESSGKRGLIQKVVKALYRFALSRNDKVLFQNPDDEQLFRHLDILPESVPSAIMNGSGVDVAEYQVSAFPQQVTFLLIARLLGDKGVREYAQAAALVKAKHPQAKFELVGWIDDNPDAISQTELDAWINSGTLTFLGKLSDVRPAIESASVYVLPSYREGTPRTVLEAMSMGRAIITTDAPGCRETVVDGANGYLIPVKSVDELATAMISFINEPAKVIAMGAKSREIAENKYDVHKVNHAMLKEMGMD
ncbi:glycosyltransferase family 4 protein [Shewanella sp. 10N.286.54.B9]|uniref:glycosyltransferase family 4 protein n=1 Tax=Shewanella sp. 10N.286.54.B9 TaxID=3229719 RepID=UPI00354FBA80